MSLILENITEVIKGCINSEHKYQKILYEYSRGFALKVVFRYIYRYEKAIDAVNDGFVKIFSHFPHFEIRKDAENERLFMGWLKKIMINVSIDHLRRGDMLPEIGGISEDVWELSDPSYNADQMLLYNNLVLLIKELPPTYRIVFNLYVVDGYSHVEIAEIIKTTVGNSKSILSRARSTLQNSIKKMEEVQVCRM